MTSAAEGRLDYTLNCRTVPAGVLPLYGRLSPQSFAVTQLSSLKLIGKLVSPRMVVIRILGSQRQV